MTNSSGSRSDDDATKVIYRKADRTEETVIMPARNVSGKGGDGETLFLPAQVDGTGAPFNPVVGWVVVAEGPGVGQFRPVYYGQNSIGRGEHLQVKIDFGDQRISREAHAFLVYDEVERKFFVRDNGKSNVVRLNGNIVLMPTELCDRDRISIGQTTLLFVALCNE